MNLFQKIFNLFPARWRVFVHFDKVLHSLAGLAIFLLGWLLVDIKIGFALASIAGFCKEMYDFKIFGKADYLDFLATIIMPLILFIIFN